LRRAVTTAANLAFVSQAAPVGPAVTPPAGLLHVSGIVDGGTVATDLDELADAVMTIEENGGQATHIIAAPSAWGSLSKFKSATGSNAALIGAPADATVRQLLGIPVLVSSAVPADSLLVLDKAAVVSAAGQVMVAISDQAYFNSDSVGVRVTWRFGQNIVRPDRVVKLAVTPPA
jgi:HK97 family phage major capsid protein